MAKLTKYSLSDQRLGEIVDEVMAQKVRDDQQGVLMRSQGLRCMCCNAILAAPTRSGECKDCEAL